MAAQDVARGVRRCLARQLQLARESVRRGFRRYHPRRFFHRPLRNWCRSLHALHDWPRLRRLLAHFLVGGGQLRHHLLALLVQAARLARLAPRQRIGGDQRQRHGRIDVAYDRVGQLGGIDLAPAHRLRRRRAREAAGVGPRVGHLQKIVVALLRDAHHFLDLRLGLQHEIFRRAAAEDEHRRSCRRSRLAA